MRYYGFSDYVSVAERRAAAERQLQRLRKQGRHLSPIAIEGRTITNTFWGQAWCRNLERYSDFANRLPRGRSYVRNGFVVDLQIAPSTVTALVSGTELYDVRITVSPVAAKQWTALCGDCAGAIDTVVELLRGRLSQAVMTRLCAERTGLFPSPNELLFSCSCPDSAMMCKHVAAALYGIGARLDHQPELLFTLRNVDQQDLVAKAETDLAARPKPLRKGRALVDEDLSEMFGIDISTSPAPARHTRAARRRRHGPPRRR